MKTWIALLRGINVGGNNRVKMAELRAMLLEMGFEEPQTLLQSGNVTFRSHEEGGVLEARLEAETERVLGVRCDYMVRSAEEWDRMIAANPFPEDADRDPAHLLAVLFKKHPPAETVATLRRKAVADERLEEVGGTLYVYFPNGIGTSKIGAIAGGTGRNWNTVLKLATMARGD